MGICTKYLFISSRRNRDRSLLQWPFDCKKSFIFYVCMTFITQHLEEIVDTLFFLLKHRGFILNSIFMYLDFDNSVCTCLAKSNMDILLGVTLCLDRLPPQSSHSSGNISFIFVMFNMQTREESKNLPAATSQRDSGAMWWFFLQFLTHLYSIYK